MRARWAPPSAARFGADASSVLALLTVGDSVNLRSGPGVFFPSIATLGYGTRVEKGLCIGGGSVRWCKVETVDARYSGFVSGRFLVEGPARPGSGDEDAGGPDYWALRGLAPGERLNVRRDPSASSPVLAPLREAEVSGTSAAGQAGMHAGAASDRPRAWT